MPKPVQVHRGLPAMEIILILNALEMQGRSHIG
jgi:hypothetical protein